MLERFKKIILLIFILLLKGCINPFAPSLDNELNLNDAILGSQKKIEGVFKNFQYAYTFKDTAIYGKLLDKDFLFKYRDYEKGVDVTWGKEEEMRITNQLFKNIQRLDLIWNDILSITEDSTNIIRSFNLTLNFNPSDVEYISGSVNLTLKKDKEKKWKIINWIDESNF